MSEQAMRVLIVGAGGHAQVVMEAAFTSDPGLHVVGFLDDNPLLHGGVVGERPVLGRTEDVSTIAHDGVLLGVGDNAARLRLYRELVERGERVLACVHRAAIVSPSASIGEGTVVLAGAVVGTGARVGAAVVLNTACTVDHHCVIADGAHLAPGVHLAGACQVGSGALLGIGAVVIPQRTIGHRAVVGAGSVVVSDVPPEVVAYGCPAQVRRRLTPKNAVAVEQ